MNMGIDFEILSKARKQPNSRVFGGWRGVSGVAMMEQRTADVRSRNLERE